MSETALSALQRATALLSMNGIEGAAQDARVLLAHVLKCDRAQLNARLPDLILPSQSFAMDQAVGMRCNNRPVSHITGKRAFWAHDFLVTSDVLDPRPETEMLVALALETRFQRLLDLGTGSGVLALSLLAERPDSRAIATDISDRALDVAQRNAGRLAVADRVSFLVSDWFDMVEGPFDLIVSNPPYIAADEMDSLAPDVREWEPHLALTPGGDGLAAYRAIAGKMSGFLAKGGRAIFEIGYRQAADVKSIFTEAGYLDVSVMKDLNGFDRVVMIKT